jgi:DNA polymerase III subunit epsilon
MAALIFFDTETTGIGKADRIVQLAWLVSDRHGRILRSQNHIIRPEGFTIPYNATKIHGISTEKAQKVGQPVNFVLNDFSSDVLKCKALVAHNIKFDLRMMRHELAMSNIDCGINDKVHLCTMKSSTNWCELPKPSGRAGFKSPKLMELHQLLFLEGFQGAHDALADVRATHRCFFELLNRGVIDQAGQSYSAQNQIRALKVKSHSTKKAVKTSTPNQEILASLKPLQSVKAPQQSPPESPSSEARQPPLNSNDQSKSEKNPKSWIYWLIGIMILVMFFKS